MKEEHTVTKISGVRLVKRAPLVNRSRDRGDQTTVDVETYREQLFSDGIANQEERQRMSVCHDVSHREVQKHQTRRNVT